MPYNCDLFSVREYRILSLCTVRRYSRCWRPPQRLPCPGNRSGYPPLPYQDHRAHVLFLELQENVVLLPVTKNVTIIVNNQSTDEIREN